MNGGQNSFGVSTGQLSASGPGTAGNTGPGIAGGNGLGSVGFGNFGGPCGSGLDSAATYSFTVGATTVTETIAGTNGNTATVVFTEETSNTSLYTVTSPTAGHGTTSSSAVTYGFSGLGTATVTETVTSSYGVQTITFTEESGSTTLYQVSSENLTVTSPTAAQANGDVVTFTLTESVSTVTAISETITNGTKSSTVSQTLDPTATFTIGSGTVTETFLTGNSVETVTFAADGSSYVVSSIAAAVIAAGTATTALSINALDRAEFTIASGAVTAVSTVSPTGTVATLSHGSNVTFTPLTNSTSLAGSFVEETVTSGSNSSYKVFYEASGSSIYTEVAHGAGTTVDLTGLATQLEKLPAANLALL